MAAYIIEVGELVCVQLGDGVDVGVVEGIQRGKVQVRTLLPDNELLFADPEALIDAFSGTDTAEDEASDAAAEEMAMEECGEAQVFAQWSAESPLPFSSVSQPSPSPSPSPFTLMYLQSGDVAQTLARIPGFGTSEDELCCSHLLAGVSSHGAHRTISLFLLLSYLAHAFPQHRLKYQRYLEAALAPSRTREDLVTLGLDPDSLEL